MTDHTALVERLNKSILFTEDGASSSLPYKAAEAITTLQSQLAERTATLEKIISGDYPRPIGETYRQDKERSKHDKCVHAKAMYEDCEECICDFLSAALKDQSQ